MIPAQKNMRSTAGFTLVELAIVMIIIGLLIAGVLKGQALIGNAKVTAQVAQVKSIDAATSTFKDMYAALPGDIVNPATRIPNCAGTCALAGNGDGNVQGAAIPFTAAPTGETLAFFPQLSSADLLTGINENAPVPLSWGGDFPAGKLNGGLHVGTLAGNAVPTAGLAIPAASFMGGLYLALHNTPGGAVAATGAITANDAARVDTKIDDGVPDSGSVFPAGAPTCILGAALLLLITKLYKARTAIFTSEFKVNSLIVIRERPHTGAFSIFRVYQGLRNASFESIR
jgi:prepilin-type N-terminal cleavage/methylation domain-containing protein